MAVNSNLRISSPDLTAQFPKTAVMLGNIFLFTASIFFMLPSSTFVPSTMTAIDSRANWLSESAIWLLITFLYLLLEYFIIMLTSHAHDLLYINMYVNQTTQTQFWYWNLCNIMDYELPIEISHLHEVCDKE